MMKRFAILALLLAAVGCGAQQPQTTHQVNLTWTGPAECTTAAPCSYILSRATVPPAGTCPAITGTFYTQVGVSNLQATAWTDTAASAGFSYCYIAQAQQAGSVGPPSLPSNIAVIPANPGAPITMNAVIR